MRQIVRDINTLKDNDLINVMLYALYKLSNDPGYSAISELSFVLDKESLYKLCATFGGATIKVPTLDELKVVINALLVYQNMNEGATFVEVCDKLSIPAAIRPEVMSLYNILLEIISDYE